MINLFLIIILLLSIIAHEYSHAWMAARLGDDTATRAGRLTLNPLAHLDIFGSIIIPGLLLLVGSPIVFGYAKPVPIDFSKLRGGFKGVAKTALAGPAANFILAIVAALAMCYLAGGPNSAWGQLLFLMAMINVVLMVFNLLPVPPLDGSKILAFLLPERWRYSYLASERWSFLVLLFIMVMFPDLIYYPVSWLMSWLI